MYISGQAFEAIFERWKLPHSFLNLAGTTRSGLSAIVDNKEEKIGTS